MEVESVAFPNAWNVGAKGDREKGKGQKGKGKGKGQKGQKGKGRAGKAGTGSRESEDLPEERRRALMGELEALAQGTETGAVPRVGDRVLLQVLGKDRAELHGRLATVRGVLPGAAAFTVRLEEGKEGTEGTEGREVTASAEDLRVVEARASPLPETSLTFPKSLTGLERKFVHEAAEALGLVSQSFGQGPERYIAVFRPAQGAPVTGVPEPEAAEAAEAAADADADVWISGVVLDEGSQDLLKSAVAVPDDWHVFADRCELCRGPLSNPKPLESANLKRSVTAEQSKELQRLRPAMPCELRVCTLARGNEGIAVGLLGLPTLDRNPHVLVAARGARGAGERCLALAGVRWEPWTGEALLLRGQLKQWHKAELSEGGG
ncbi:unnamed protein product [Symbiodinium necroappetens]|uniref:R3H domain-containing protein n=1 Tax=Symbiodinium necroappetens TaxID=1628268 RepID=A0A812YTK3_9DINO|nr:unnamed protein product [Symbiodinium necroappetens]